MHSLFATRIVIYYTYYNLKWMPDQIGAHHFNSATNTTATNSKIATPEIPERIPTASQTPESHRTGTRSFATAPKRWKTTRPSSALGQESSAANLTLPRRKRNFILPARRSAEAQSDDDVMIIRTRSTRDLTS